MSTTKTSWWHGVVNIQTVFALGAAFSAIVAFVIKVNNDNTDLKTKASKEEVQQLREQMFDFSEKFKAQTTLQDQKNEKEGQQIEEALDWQHEWDGYWKRVIEEKK